MAPMIVGIVSSFLLEPMVDPAIYQGWRGRRLSVKTKTGGVDLNSKEAS